MRGLRGALYANMPEYAWLCLANLNMPGYVWICLKYAWMAFVLYFPIVIPCLYESVGTYFNVYTKLEVLVWRKIRLFSWSHKIRLLLFSFFFLGGGGVGGVGGWGGRRGVKGVWLGVGVQPVNRDISYFSLILLRHNVDEKNLRKTDAKIDVNQGLQEIWCRTTQILVLKRQLRSS